LKEERKHKGKRKEYIKTEEMKGKTETFILKFKRAINGLLKHV
jgi:hypothetical protein